MSSDVFQNKMDDILKLSEGSMAYFDNIILYTKSTFEHHFKIIQAVLQVIRKNNLHVHIDKTFLAAQAVDCLGYFLTAKASFLRLRRLAPSSLSSSLLIKCNFDHLWASPTTTRNYGIAAATPLRLGPCKLVAIRAFFLL
eukprot:11461288-Ditylum_brightwellii.AAC.1